MINTLKDLFAPSLDAVVPFGYEKYAQAGGAESPDDLQMEQDFSRLAYMFLQDRAAPLLEHILGFEVVQRAEDGSRAVGIFGFKIGDDYYYVPAFFVNNQIKGMDLLFNKRTNMFMPLQEDWIDYIVDRQTIELGMGNAEPDVNKDFERPNFDFLSKYPGSHKYGADNSFLSLSDAWYAMHDQIVDALEKDADFQDEWCNLVRFGAGEPVTVEKSAENSALRKWIESTGGPKAMSTLLGALVGDVKYANAALSLYPDIDSLYVHEFDPKFFQKTAAKITVTTQRTEYTDGKAAKRLVRDGFTIEDTRREDEKSKLYDFDYTQMFSNPTEPGEYNVLMANGRISPAWVFLPSAAAKNKNAVVVNKGAKVFAVAEPSAIFVRDDRVAGPDAAYKAATSLGSAPFDTKLVLIDENGHCTKPLTLKSVVSESGKRTHLIARWVYTKVTKGTKTEDTAPYGGECGDDNGVTLQLADHKGSITTSGDKLIVPSNWKALQLKSSVDDSLDYDTTEAADLVFSLGTTFDLEEAMRKHALHKLTVASDDGTSYYFQLDGNFVTNPVSYKQASVDLVTRLGLDADDVEGLLKEAATQYKARRLVKFAQLVGVSMPQMQEQSASVDPYTGMPLYSMPYEQEQTGQFTGLPPEPDPDAEGINIGGQSEMDMDARGLAEQAAQLGQRTVFDHASIGGLAKVYDTSALIDSYVPELVKSLDRIGRLIFLYYWKNEDFADRYGTTGIADLEDLLRNVFKSYGELVLQLRKKAIDAEDVSTLSM